MAEQPRPADPIPVPDKGAVAAGQPPATPPTVASPAADPAANKLTPEEQMALFEKDLKEKDWGHQPC